MRAEPAMPRARRRGRGGSEAIAVFSRAAKEVLTRPLAAFAWTVALFLTVVVAPVWGSAPSMIGWIRSRARIRSEGLVGLGEVLAPEVARRQFEEGVWRGVWRTQTLGLAILVIELPTIVLALVPAAMAFGLAMPLGSVMPGAAGMIVSKLVPGLVAFACLMFVAAQQVLLLRIIGESGARWSLGLVFRAAGAAWSTVLEDGAFLVTFAALVLGGSLAAGAFVGGSAYLATQLQLAAGMQLVLVWSGSIAGFVFSSLLFETLVSWAESAQVRPIEAGSHFSFSAWLRGWLGSAVEWFAKKGLVSLGIGACAAVGLATAVVALATGQNFSSFVGLGWFAVTAGVLIVHEWIRGRA
jgi:hypothetical protein